MKLPIINRGINIITEKTVLSSKRCTFFLNLVTLLAHAGVIIFSAITGSNDPSSYIIPSIFILIVIANLYLLAKPAEVHKRIALKKLKSIK